MCVCVCVCILVSSCQSDNANYALDVNVDVDNVLEQRAIDSCFDDLPCSDQVESVTVSDITFPDYPGCMFSVIYSYVECEGQFYAEITDFTVNQSCPSYQSGLIAALNQGDNVTSAFLLGMQRRFVDVIASDIAALSNLDLPQFPAWVTIGAFYLAECGAYCLPYDTTIEDPFTSGSTMIINCGDVCCSYPIQAAIRDGEIFTLTAFPASLAGEDTCEEDNSPIFTSPCEGKAVYYVPCAQHCDNL